MKKIIILSCVLLIVAACKKKTTTTAPPPVATNNTIITPTTRTVSLYMLPSCCCGTLNIKWKYSAVTSTASLYDTSATSSGSQPISITRIFSSDTMRVFTYGLSNCPVAFKVMVNGNITYTTSAGPSGQDYILKLN